jgi:LPS-assembly protein
MRARKTYAFLGLILALGLLGARPLFAQAGKAGGAKPQEQIDFTADSMSVTGKGAEVEGQGNVEIKRQEMILHADQVQLNRETQEMQATGNVTVDDPEWKIKQASRVRFNLGEETGTIENGDLFLEKGHLTLSGSRLQKLSGQSYHIDDGIFTTCLCEDGPPSWKIAAKEIDIEREGMGKIKGGIFYIMDVPVFYLPYALFPVRTDRQTGFLFPEIGSSSRSGVRFVQPFYWAISKSSDATVSFDIEAKARVGAVGQYRSIFNKDFSAQIDTSYFNESFRHNPDGDVGDHTIADCIRKPIVPPPLDLTANDFTTNCNVIPRNRWSVVANHRQTAASGWTTYSDVALFSDDFFVRELTHNLHFNYDQERDIKTSRYTQARAGFLQGWGDATLQGEWNYYQDFIQADKRTLQRTPQIAFTGRKVLWNTPLELRWRAAGINYLSQAAPDGLRFDIRPELALPFNLANYLHGSLSVAPRETLYHLYDNTTSFSTVSCPLPLDKRSCVKNPESLRSFTRNNSRELVEVTGNVGTSFGRVFSWNGAELQKINHLIEPEVSYLFVSHSKQNDIPIMDGVDRVNHRNLLSFSLTNRFWGKYSQGAPALPEDRDIEMVAAPTEGDTRELGSLKLAINYSVENTRTAGGRLSDVDIGLRITPKDYLAFGVGTGISPYSGQVSQTVAIFSIFDPRPITRRVLDQDFMRPNSLDLSYRFIGKTVNSPLAENANPILVDPSSPNKVCSSLNTKFGETFDPRCQRSNVQGLLGLRALVHLTDHLLFLYDTNYNFQKNRFATNRGALKILSKCECWSLTLALNQSTNPNVTSFKFNFDLLGLSSQSKPSFK